MRPVRKRFKLIGIACINYIWCVIYLIFPINLSNIVIDNHQYEVIAYESLLAEWVIDNQSDLVCFLRRKTLKGTLF